ncbi:MAG TPA: aryldialkylphosphatase [Dehalococcoidia bacterium]
MSAGKVRTVLGDVEPSELGITHTHEHFLWDPARWRREAGLLQRRELQDPRSRQPLTLETYGYFGRNWTALPDNHLLDDESLAIEEAMRFKEAGGRTLADATNADMNRDPAALARISKATGLHVVMGAGHYVGGSQPLDMDERSETQIADRIAADVISGADGTEIRSGMIGEMGMSSPMTANERKALRAASAAQRRTGAALMVHPSRAESAPMEAIEVIREAGGDLGRTIMAHVDRTLFEPNDMLTLAKTGCYLEFDLFGQESSHYPLAPIDMPNDAARINHIQRLTAEGFGDKLLIAHDICRRTSLVKYGGYGYGHILENVVPIMRRKGMSDDQIDALLIRNPARILTLAQPS